jgi:hypothetical protein
MGLQVFTVYGGVFFSGEEKWCRVEGFGRLWVLPVRFWVSLPVLGYVALCINFFFCAWVS